MLLQSRVSDLRKQTPRKQKQTLRKMVSVSVLKWLDFLMEKLHNEVISRKQQDYYLGSTRIYKKSPHKSFRGCSEELLFWNFWKIPRKASLVKFLLIKSSCQICYLQLKWKLAPLQVLLVNAPKFFKTSGRASVVDSFFRAGEILHPTNMLKTLSYVLVSSKIWLF